MLKLIINEPFDVLPLKDLFQNENDLTIACPFSKIPFCEKEWNSLFLTSENNVSLLFTYQDQLVGQIAFLPKGEDVYLCHVILREEKRGQGLGERMMILAEEYCRARYLVNVVYLNVSKINFKALNLYLKLGYEIVNENESTFKMQKVLPEEGP